MMVTDLVMLPLACIACGLLAAPSPLLGSLPALGRIIRGLQPFRIPLGALAVLAGLLALLFPAHGPPFLGSLFPAVIGITIGLTLSVDALLDVPLIRRHRRILASVGNALIYLRTPLGILSVFCGVLHLASPATPFF